MSTSDAGEKAMPKELGQIAEALQKVAKPIVNALTIIIPFVITTTIKLRTEFRKLPQNCIQFIYGFIFCFFGGAFPTLFAALQAAEYGGRKMLAEAISDLSDEAMIIIEESKKDDKVDEDNDGKEDVEQISGAEYMKRKTMLVLKKMNPDKIDRAISSIYTVWLSVAAVLSVEFARTISMALTISDFLMRPCNRFIEPTLRKITPDEYEKWVPVILAWIAKSIGMSIAWYIETVRSAAASALKGGLLMAHATYNFLVYRKIDFFGLIPIDDESKHEETAFDEVLSYIFAALGFYVQFRSGFQLPFPMNILLSPFLIVEYYIRWSITGN